MQTGTIGLYIPGADRNDPRLKGIPLKTLPSGCTNPDVEKYIRYAEEYNTVILPLVKQGLKVRE